MWPWPGILIKFDSTIGNQQRFKPGYVNVPFRARLGVALPVPKATTTTSSPGYGALGGGVAITVWRALAKTVMALSDRLVSTGSSEKVLKPGTGTGACGCLQLTRVPAFMIKVFSGKLGISNESVPVKMKM